MTHTIRTCDNKASASVLVSDLTASLAASKILLMLMGALKSIISPFAPLIALSVGTSGHGLSIEPRVSIMRSLQVYGAGPLPFMPTGGLSQYSSKKRLPIDGTGIYKWFLRSPLEAASTKRAIICRWM